MNKTTKVILMSVITIIACVSLISGATFALFTSESSVNVAVTSGKVQVEVTPTVTGAYSALWDESSSTYVHDDKELVDGQYNFTTGGTASLTDSKLTLTNIVPGDGVTMQLEIKNYSTVATKYRLVMTANDSELMKQLKVTITAAEGSSLPEIQDGGDAKFTLWTDLDAAPEDGEALGSLDFAVELPIDATNAAQGTEGNTADINVTVEAVQGNATTTNMLAVDHAYYVTDTVDFVAVNQMFNSSSSSKLYDVDIALTNDVDLSPSALAAAYVKLNRAGGNVIIADANAANGISVISIGANQTKMQFNKFYGVFNGNGHTISNFYCVGSYGRGVGFFQYVGEAEGSWNGEVVIENVTFKNATVETDSAKSGGGMSGYAGLLVGEAYDNLTIRNVTVEDCVVRSVTDWQKKAAAITSGFEKGNVSPDYLGTLVAIFGSTIRGQSATLTIENVTVSLDMTHDEFYYTVDPAILSTFKPEYQSKFNGNINVNEYLAATRGQSTEVILQGDNSVTFKQA